jgi:hypothetical protein
MHDCVLSYGENRFNRVARQLENDLSESAAIDHYDAMGTRNDLLQQLCNFVSSIFQWRRVMRANQ